MSSRPEELRDRTKAFALRVIRLFRSLPYRTDTQVLGKQLLRCGTSVAANYRAACRARSKAEFIARIAVVAEEADEAVLWLELLIESGIIKSEMTVALLKEAKELAAILTASRETAKKSA
ncbi:MAG TPA: four helix bundle protein [Candidatus Sulfotelmatobacter sp.]|nr:four helix bundle protein [Candidatus Sulfotelmatobacter sp.]